MDTITVAKMMNHRIAALEQCRKEIHDAGIEKANSAIEYEKKLASVLIQLRNGCEFTHEGEIVRNPPTTIMKDIAKGVCYVERLRSELAETNYKSIIVKINALTSELNGFQSINRYLKDDVGV